MDCQQKKRLLTIFFKYLYKTTRVFGKNASHLIRYLIYRKCVLKHPEDLITLQISEDTYIKVENSNKKIKFSPQNPTKRIGILGSLSNSLIFTKEFFKILKNENEYEIYLYEFLSNGFISFLKNYKNHYIIPAFYYKSPIDKVFKDTFDYIYLSKLINSHNLDYLIVSIETLGRFTYGKLFNEIITNTKIITINAGNIFYVHPKIWAQNNIQLPPGWKIEGGKLRNTKGCTINNYIFYKELFMYDRRDIDIDFNYFNLNNFKNVIFYHGRLSNINSNKFLDVISYLLKKDRNRKFVFMGYDDKNVLTKIFDFFKNKNVANQVEYKGFFSQKKDKYGNIKDEKWKECKNYLKESAVFLNPFPNEAGSSRIEAFMSGLPVIDLVQDFTNYKAAHNKNSILELLIKKEGTARDLDEYLKFSEKIFYDQNFRKNIITEQYMIVKEFCDEKIFWEKIKKIIKNS